MRGLVTPKSTVFNLSLYKCNLSRVNRVWQNSRHGAMGILPASPWHGHLARVKFHGLEARATRLPENLATHRHKFRAKLSFRPFLGRCHRGTGILPAPPWHGHLARVEFHGLEARATRLPENLATHRQSGLAVPIHFRYKFRAKLSFRPFSWEASPCAGFLSHCLFVSPRTPMP